MSYTDLALKSPRSKEIDSMMSICEEGSSHYIAGLLLMNGYEPSLSKYEPVFYLYDILKENSELSEKEVLCLIDNSLSSVLDNELS